MNKIRNWGVATVATLSTAAAFAQEAGTSAFDTVLDAVGLSGISVKVIAMAVIVVGIAIAYKSPDLAKRIIRKV